MPAILFKAFVNHWAYICY